MLVSLTFTYCRSAQFEMSAKKKIPQLHGRVRSNAEYHTQTLITPVWSRVRQRDWTSGVSGDCAVDHKSDCHPASSTEFERWWADVVTWISRTMEVVHTQLIRELGSTCHHLSHSFTHCHARAHSMLIKPQTINVCHHRRSLDQYPSAPFSLFSTSVRHEKHSRDN